MMRALLLLLGLPAAAMAEDTMWNIKLMQGTTPALSNKPAEIYYVTEDGESSSATNAAIKVAYGLAALNTTSNRFAESEVFFGASLARNSLKSKPQHLRGISTGIDTFWNAANENELGYRSTLSYNREEDRIKRTKGHMERLDLSAMRVCPAGDFDVGQAGLAFTCYPYAGYYRRRISQTNNAATSPIGSVGGPFIGFFVNVQLGKVTKDAEWLAPFSIEADAYRLKDSNVSAGYAKAYYKHASLAVSYAMQTGGSNWKPRISLIREIGTDRLSNRERGGATKLAFQIGYELAPKKL